MDGPLVLFKVDPVPLASQLLLTAFKENAGQCKAVKPQRFHGLAYWDVPTRASAYPKARACGLGMTIFGWARQCRSQRGLPPPWWANNRKVRSVAQNLTSRNKNVVQDWIVPQSRELSGWVRARRAGREIGGTVSTRPGEVGSGWAAAQKFGPLLMRYFIYQSSSNPPSFQINNSIINNKTVLRKSDKCWMTAKLRASPSPSSSPLELLWWMWEAVFGQMQTAAPKEDSQSGAFPQERLPVGGASRKSWGLVSRVSRDVAYHLD